jgi:chromate transporter
MRGAKALTAALSAIGAAVVGVIMNLAVWFALHVLFARMVIVNGVGAYLELPVLSTANVPSAVLTLAAAVAAFRFKVGMIPLLLACSGLGVVYFLLTGSPAAHS